MPAGAWIAVFAAVAAPRETAPPQSDTREIIVTGERVLRSLRETASSVEVVTSADLEKLAAPDRVDQVLETVPNVTLGSGGEGPTIRGQDTTGPLRDLFAFLGGARPRTTLIVDGRPVSFNEFIFGTAPIWDVERIEVFRSPQTTTQGKNSIAGAIFVQTRDPAMEGEARGRVIVGNQGERHLSAVLSQPLLEDQLAFRISGDFRYSGLAADIRDRVPGADADHDVYGLARFKLLATPTALPGARIGLTYTHTQSQMPGSELIRRPFRKRQDLSGFAGIFRTNVDSATGSVGYDFGDGVVANATLTHGDAEVQRFALPMLGQTKIRVKDWFGETVLNWSPGGPIGLLGGVSHSRQHLRQHIEPVFLIGQGDFDDRQVSTGLFGEARFQLSQKANLTAGLRYQRDGQERVGVLGSGASALNLDFDRSFDAWLPKLSFAYDFSPSFRAGALVQRAYNPGGVNIRADIGAVDTFEAEKMWDYELFARASLAGGAVRLTTNLFYYDIEDAQRAQPYSVQGVGLADLFNAPKARSYGLEAQVDWRVSERFSAGLGLGLLRTRIVRVEDAYANFEGNEFQRSPHLTATASVHWRPVERLRLTAQARHSSGYWSDELNDPFRRVHRWTKVDARAEWEAGRFKLFGYARNIFDNFYMTWLFNSLSGTAGDPREVGIGLESRF